MVSGVHLENKVFLGVQDYKVNEETVQLAFLTHRIAYTQMVSMITSHAIFVPVLVITMHYLQWWQPIVLVDVLMVLKV